MRNIIRIHYPVVLPSAIHDLLGYKETNIKQINNVVKMNSVELTKNIVFKEFSSVRLQFIWKITMMCKIDSYK